MNRIEEMFTRVGAAGKKALVVYLCMGDPDLAQSTELALAAITAGADMVELGVPFSDPTADGPVITRAAARAIRSGTTLSGVLASAAKIRAQVPVPLVLFTYYNPVLALGEERTVEQAQAAGIDALLVVDLPPEEGASLRAAAARAGIAMVPLVAPTSDAARVSTILSAVRSMEGAPAAFLYLVSMTGVTGAGSADLEAACEQAGALRARSDWPVVVGFGIDGPDAARKAAGKPGEGPDGVVVGSAIVRKIEEGKTPDERVKGVEDLVHALRTGLDQGSR